MNGLNVIPNLDAQVAAALKPMAKPGDDEIYLQQHMNATTTDLGATDPIKRAHNLTMLAGTDGDKVVAGWFKTSDTVSTRKDFYDAVIKQVDEAMHDPAKQKEMLAAAGGLLNTREGTAESYLQAIFSGQDPGAESHKKKFAGIVVQETLNAYMNSTPVTEQSGGQDKGAQSPPPRPKAQHQL